jgi:hypothetical protein
MLKNLRHLEQSAFSKNMRSARWERLIGRFPDLAAMSVVDLGGTERSWDLSPVKPSRLLLVNAPDALAQDRENVLLGDACDPDLLAGEHFDLVYSNSVIEHVGGHRQRSQFAANVYRLATHHWVQTPYRYFPIEPHWAFPAFQFLPVAARKHAMRWWPIGNWAGLMQADSSAVEAALSVELLSKTEMAHYFPRSTVAVERVAGFVKSLIAIG